MTTKKTARKFNSSVISQLLEETTVEEQLQIKTKMTLAARLDDLISAKGWGKSEFAEKIKKSPSEITRWLSGTQNFTLDTLAEIAATFEIPVESLFVRPPAQIVYKVKIVLPAEKFEQGIRITTPPAKGKTSGRYLLTSDFDA